MSLRTSLIPARTPGKLMLAKRSFPFGMPSIPNYWFQEGKTTGWGWGKDDLLTKYQRSGGQQPNATHIRLRIAVTVLGLLWCFLYALTFKGRRSSWLTQPITTSWSQTTQSIQTLMASPHTGSVFTLQSCGQLEMTTSAPPSKMFLFLTRCISSEASEHISDFMGLLLGTKKISLPSV